MNFFKTHFLNEVFQLNRFNLLLMNNYKLLKIFKVAQAFILFLNFSFLLVPNASGTLLSDFFDQLDHDGPYRFEIGDETISVTDAQIIETGILFAKSDLEQERNIQTLKAFLVKLEDNYFAPGTGSQISHSFRLREFYHKLSEFSLKHFVRNLTLTAEGIHQIIKSKKDRGEIPLDIDVFTLTQLSQLDETLEMIKEKKKESKTGLYFFIGNHVTFIWVESSSQGNLTLFNFDSIAGNLPRSFLYQAILVLRKLHEKGDAHMTTLRRQVDGYSCAHLGIKDLEILATMEPPITQTVSMDDMFKAYGIPKDLLVATQLDIPLLPGDDDEKMTAIKTFRSEHRDSRGRVVYLNKLARENRIFLGNLMIEELVRNNRPLDLDSLDSVPPTR